MVENWKKHIESSQLFSSSDTLLVGVSGGIDSVVLLDLLNFTGLAFAVAHCNFRLRGEESDLDEKFVKELAGKYEKPYYSQAFDTDEYASDHGISIEMAARDLRYEWFEKIRRTHHFDWIVVAHSSDDQIETFFLNLARGTGISGLTGMKTVNGKVIRPLLFASRKEIEMYASARKLQFREDSSNALTVYQRNRIRHMLLPIMEEINPSFRASMQETIGHLRDTSSIYYTTIQRARDMVVQVNHGSELALSIAELQLLQPLSTYLFEILKPFHFNGDVVEEIVKALDGQSGKQFFSTTHRAVLDREVLLIQQLTELSDARFYLEEDCEKLHNPIRLAISTQIRTASLKLNTAASTALIDKDKVQFPMILRRWQKGDSFQPLGMQGMKKLSDFFVDEKFSLTDKENCWLLTNGEEIIWIVGVRLDDRYKISHQTTNVLEIKLF
ncbi:MAG: tRNA lysidine(34) synthetase TilS [Prolixibacteraceae bacterium]